MAHPQSEENESNPPTAASLDATTESASSPNSIKPKLKLALEDSFDQDSRTRYKTGGDVQWKQGQMTVAGVSTFQHKLDAGSWLVIEFDIEFPKLENDGESSQFKIWLDFDGTSDTFIWFRQRRLEGKNRSSILAMNTSGDCMKPRGLTAVKQPLVRDVLLESGRWRLEYRYGMWRVTSPNQTFVYAAHIENNAASTRRFIVRSNGVPIAVRSILVKTTAKSKWRNNAVNNQKLKDISNLQRRRHAAVENGKLVEAIEILKEILKLQKSVLGPFHPDVATTLNNMALLHHSTGQFVTAEELLISGLELRGQIMGTDHLSYSTSLSHLGSLYATMGKYDEAEANFLKSLAIDRKLIGEDSRPFAVSLHNGGMLYKLMGKFDKAIPMLENAADITGRLSGTDSTEYGIVIGSLAAIYEAMKAFEKSEPLFLQSLQILEKNVGRQSIEYAVMANNLALLYQAHGHYKKAEGLFLRSKEVYEKAIGKKHNQYAATVSNLAMNFRLLDSPAKSRALFLEALAIQKDLHGRRSHPYASSLSNLAGLCRSMKEYEKAEAMLLECEGIFDSTVGKEHLDYSSCQNNLADLYAETGKFDEAEKRYRTSLNIVHSNMERFSVVQSEQQQRKYHSSFARLLDAYLSLAIKSKKYSGTAYEMAVKWKGSTQLRQSQYRELANQATSSQLYNQLRSISQQLFVHLGGDPYEPNWRNRLDHLNLKKESIEKKLAATSALFRTIQTSPDIKKIQNALPTHSVLVDFNQVEFSDPSGDSSRTEKRLIAFVVRKNLVSLLDLGEIESILNAIVDFRKRFNNQTNTISDLQKSDATALLLRRRIWLPIEREFGVPKIVLISPDGELGTLPFAALPGKSRNSFLINEYLIGMIPVPRLLPQMMANPVVSDIKNVLLVGDVDYSSTGGMPTRPLSQSLNGKEVSPGRWPKLKETGIEVDTLDSVFRSTTSTRSIMSLRRAEATEQAFRGSAPKSNLVHVATHGFFAPEKFKTNGMNAKPLSTEPISKVPESTTKQYPNVSGSHRLYYPGLLSGLVFAGANSSIEEGGSDDGIMTAEEISFLPLENTQLVTLSACETGLGKAAGGEGLIGIQRAFQVAGARTTVASLWNVDDLATRKLMERFYKNMLVKKMGKLEALVDAQRWLLQNPKIHSDINRGIVGKAKNIKNRDQHEDYLHPRFWAAWTLSGDWR